MDFNRRSFLKASLGTALQVGIVANGYSSSLSVLSATTTTNQRLTRVSPESLGVSSRAILELIAALENSNASLHSLMILKKGKVIAEGWWAPYAPDLKHTLYSLSKSFTSTAIGLAVQEGKLSVHDQVISFFKDQQPAHVSPHLASMRIRDLLSMTTGHSTDTLPRFRDPSIKDWVKDFLAQPVTYQPGTHFLYNSGATYMLSAILQKVTGQSLLNYLTPRLFEPLGIVDADWEVDPQGICVGGWGLRLKTEDIAKFGQLYLQEGNWQGKQLIAKNWVREATIAHIMQPGKEEDREKSDWLQGYGYQFWRCKNDAYRGDGAYGQYCIVMPQQEMVIAITSETSDMQVILNHIWKYVLQDHSSSGNVSESTNQKLLEQRLKDLSLPLPKGNSVSKNKAKFHKKVYHIQDNAVGLKSIQFDFNPTTVSCKMVDSKGTHELVAGINAWREGETYLDMEWLKLIPTPIGSNPALQIVATGHWVNAHAFQLLIRFIDTAHYQKVVYHFLGKELKIEMHKSVDLMSGNQKPAYTLKGKQL